jgi:glycosyltransferase involved in cell wall biosynthesis
VVGSPSSPREQRVLGVIIPAYNEESSVEQVIRRVLREPSVQQVVVVGDCSSDGTLAAARRCTSDPRVTVKHHDANQGKGAAIRTGLQAINAPLVLIQDADLEYDPADYEKLI